MRKIKKILVTMMVAVMLGCFLTGCGDKKYSVEDINEIGYTKMKEENMNITVDDLENGMYTLVDIMHSKIYSAEYEYIRDKSGLKDSDVRDWCMENKYDYWIGQFSK